MTKVEEKSLSQKKFIPAQVGIHNRAVDYLTLMQKCINKINDLKKVIDNIDADRDLLPAFSVEGHEEIRREAVLRHDNQVCVYRWLLARYLTHVARLYTPAMYEDMAFHPQPDALKNVAAVV